MSHMYVTIIEALGRETSKRNAGLFHCSPCLEVVCLWWCCCWEAGASEVVVFAVAIGRSACWGAGCNNRSSPKSRQTKRKKKSKNVGSNRDRVKDRQMDRARKHKVDKQQWSHLGLTVFNYLNHSGNYMYLPRSTFKHSILPHTGICF
jgi:hypothetical protein